MTHSAYPGLSTPFHPLEGIRVVDITTMINGPVAAMMLADMGADVIKIEPPDGDPWRPIVGGFLAYNRGKRFISLDLKAKEGKRIAEELIAKADILVENTRWGVCHRLGLDYESVSKINPDIIYLTVTGHGTSGPYSGLPGYDPLLQARSGHMVGQGGRDQPPVFHAIPINDVAGPMLGAYGVALALLHRLRTGQGQHVVTSLTNAAIALQVCEFMNYPGRKHENRGGQRLIGVSATHRHYWTSDNRWILIFCANEGHWEQLCAVVERKDLMSDARFNSPEKRLKNAFSLGEIMETTFKKKTSAEWLNTLTAAEIPASLGQTNSEVMNDPHCRATGIFEERDHPFLGPTRHHGISPRFSDMTGVIRQHGLSLGEHTVEVLQELGFTEEEIERFIDDHIAFLPEGDETGKALS